MDIAEALAKERSEIVTLAVGLYQGYASAQRMYVKRGYLPDGTGMWYGNNQVTPGSGVFVDDDLVLYFSKQL